MMLAWCTGMVAAAPTIGTISSNGRFQMNGAETWNQSALQDGALIETGSSASRLLLRNGTDLRIAADSSSRVYADRMLLRNGVVQGILANTFRLETGVLGLRLHGEQAHAHVHVDRDRVLIASLQGTLKVRGSAGNLLASVTEGNAVQLSQAQPGAAAEVQLNGLIQHSKDGYFIKDTTSNVVVQLKGSAVAKYVGKTGNIRGTVDSSKPTVPNAEYVVRLDEWEEAAAAVIAGKTPAKTAGMGAATKTGIIAGVVVAAASTTGLVVAGDSEEAQTVSPLR
ncbi:MAG: hypothetical protein MUF01_07880 [Bryobacterales bacterium]|jgi:hypothetical protein|nr:hypothetical protein [Bryobacterales bacterium]